MSGRALAGILSLVAIAAGGCGSSGSSATAPADRIPSGQPPQLDRQALAGFERCLKKHGGTMPGAGGPPSGAAGQPQGQPPGADAKTQKAMRACSRYLPAQPQGGAGG